MDKKIKKLIRIVKGLPDESIEQVIGFATKIAVENNNCNVVTQDETTADIEEKSEDLDSEPLETLEGAARSLRDCPNCRSSNVTRFGHKHGKQRYRCKECDKTYVETTGTIMDYSHLDERAWRQAVLDMVEGRPLRATEEALDISHDTAFRMRHKILVMLEQYEIANTTTLSGDCELDETYVLEDLKGKKIPEEYWRGPRRHGAKAKLRGISHEQVCIMTGIERGGKAYAVTRNLALPSKDDIKSAFHDHIAEGTNLFCDGEKGYDVLCQDRKCNVTHTETRKINTVNGFHSFIKNFHNHIYHGVATKYLNRYNALFATVYRHREEAFEIICGLLGISSNIGKTRRLDLSQFNILKILTVV